MKGSGTVWLLWTALLAASLEPVIVKWAFSRSPAPLELMSMRMLAGSLFALPLLFRWRPPRGRQLRLALAVSALFLSANLFIYLALARVPATVLITLVSSTPAFVALVNMRRGRDSVRPSFWAGLAVCLAGIALTVDIFGAPLSGLGFAGAAFTAMAVLSSTVYRTTMDDATAAISPIELTCFIFLTNGLAGAVLAAFTGPFPRSFYAPALWLGFAAVAANAAFLYALNAVGSTRISVFSLLQRPLAIILAAVALKERLSAAQLAGIALVLAGLEAARRGQRRVGTPAGPS